MKKNLSVLALLLRLKMKWVLITLIAMPVISWAAFFAYTASKKTISFRFGKGHVVFIVVFGIASLVIVLACAGLFLKNTQKRYLLERLQISERKVFLWDIAACILFLLMLWMMEIITIGTAGLIYSGSPWSKYGTVDVIYGLYTKHIYCRVLPLSDIRGWLYGLFYVICGGFLCACLSMVRGRKILHASILGFVLGVLTIGFIREENWILTAVVAVAVVVSVILCFRKLHNGKERSEDETFDC